MIYDCATCRKALPPAATACPHCGGAFEDAVPDDAEVPPGELAFRAAGPGQGPSPGKDDGPASPHAGAAGAEPGPARRPGVRWVAAAVAAVPVAALLALHVSGHGPPTPAGATGGAPAAAPAPSGLVLLSSHLRRDSADTGSIGAGSIDGRVRNGGPKALRYAQVEFGLYDKDGSQVGSALATVNGLGPGDVWDFSAGVLPDNVASYKVQGLTGF